MNKLYTVEEVVELLPLTKRGLHYLVTEGEIGHLRIGRRLYFNERDIETFLERRHVEPAKPAGGGRNA